MNILQKRMSFLVVLFLGLMPLFSVSAQEAPATPVPGTAPTGILAQFDIRELASPHAEVWFLRAELEPDGVLPLGVQTGQTVLYVESGTITVEADGIVFDVDRNMIDAKPTEPLVVDAAGSMMIVRDTESRVTNTADVPATFLVLMMYAAMDEGVGQENLEQPVGLTQVGVSVGTAEFPPAPARLVMERVVVEPGATLQNVTLPSQEGGPGWMGIDLGTIETGSTDLVIEQQSFQNLIWRSMSPEEFSPPEQVMLTGTTSLERGESYACFNSVITFTNTGQEPLTILRVIVSPHMGP